MLAAFAQSIALVGGTIFPNPASEPIRNGVVFVEQGRIAAMGERSAIRLAPGVQSIDCSGATILAGFWNSHVHFFERKWANAAALPAVELGRQMEDAFTRYGFTSVFDLSSLWENTRAIRERVESGVAFGPRIRSTGEGLLPRKPGIPAELLNFMGVAKVPMPEVSDAAEATAAVARLLGQGVDGVKFFVSAPSKAALSEAVMKPAVDAAHRAGKPVFAHPNTAADVLAAVRAGVDIVGHTTPQGGPWDEALLAIMQEHRVAVTPTLTIWKYFLRHDRVSAQDAAVKAATGQLRAWAALGGEVLFGTDLGAVDPDPSDEYALMAASGMTFSQILASLTTAPARRFGDAEKLGRIAPGLAADLVVVEGDPSRDLRALTAVRYTLRDGAVIYRGKR